MVTTSFNNYVIPIETAAQVAENTRKLINDRRTGKIKSLRTRWNKLNRVTMNGFEHGTIITIGGMSASGKSAFANMLQQDFAEFNDDEIVTLYFSLEMSPERQFIRLLSSTLKTPVRTLMSADRTLADTTMDKIEDELYKLSKESIYYVATQPTVEQIELTINAFKQKLTPEQTLIVIIDHTLLIKGKSSEGAKATIDDLQTSLNFLKKTGKVILIQLSQLNREIESSDRIRNVNMHYPIPSDLSDSSNMFRYSDYVLIIHRPETLQIQAYGPNQFPTKNKVYLHLLKNRDAGTACLIQFENNLQNNNITEL
jgi:replicative DNA helicase